MRQVIPTAAEGVDPLDLYPVDERPRPSDRPWVMANMVASVDGAIAIDGVSGGLGGEGDSIVFRAVRASCDWIVAAAGTVRAERYRVPQPSALVAERRQSLGRAPAPRLAVVTGSVDLDPDLPLFAERPDDADKALVITGSAPPPDAVERIGDAAEWCHLTTERPTPSGVIASLGERGANVVLLEGGPSFNGQMVDAGLVDELCLSISPHLVGGTSPRIVHRSTSAVPAELSLQRVLEHDGALFLRYVRR
ncbi:MAG: dihydrofolate reductase family protein [Actinomycetota bacterium]